MKSRPILFSGPMVRAILDGSKTQTRRIVKPQSAILTPQMCKNMGVSPLPEKSAPVIDCSYGQPGDHLKVRETWKADQIWDDHKPSQIPKGEPIIYTADEHATGIVPFAWGKSRPSIFLPSWASRITLEITGIRVERLGEISEGDAMSEGAGFLIADHEYLNGNPDQYRRCYEMLWESINGPGSWDANPWVWVVTFKRIEGGAK